VTAVGATCLAVALAALATASTAAAQGQVYDPLPPPGSAYVRFVNASTEDIVLHPDFLATQRLGAAGAQRITAYLVVENVAGKRLGVQMQAGSTVGEASFSAAPGSFNTVLVERAGHLGEQAGPGQALQAVQVVDRTDFNQSRARLSFYNATPACGSAALAIVPDGPAVFQDLAPGTATARSVNPVTAAVKASCTGQAAAPFDLKDMEAGGMYSIWLMQDGDGVISFLTRDATAKWKR
jgi:hypothetical protein